MVLHGFAPVIPVTDSVKFDVFIWNIKLIIVIVLMILSDCILSPYFIWSALISHSLLNLHVLITFTLNRFLGHFQPQLGKPSLWELDSDQHYNVGRHGSHFVNGNSRYARIIHAGHHSL